MSQEAATSSKQVPRWKFVMVVALATLIVVLTVQNADTVELDLLFWSFAMPRAVLIVTVLGVGFVLGSWWRARRNRRR
ncbi:MAG: lipopolysaccharide assembly protein LapA domain-containing protein [Planctomycetota bacterium]|jgi:uncharacterized integral membrane protein